MRTSRDRAMEEIRCSLVKAEQTEDRAERIGELRVCAP